MGNLLVGLRVKNHLNSATREAAKPARLKGLNATDVEVQPKMVEVEYHETRVKVAEYNPQIGFNPENGAQHGSPISRNSLFISKDRKTVRMVAIIGGAGYGKTEILKEIANDVMDKKTPGLEDVEIVWFIYFRDLAVSKEMTPGELLLGYRNLSQKQICEFTEWIRENSHKVLLVLDGADQYQQIDKLGKYSSLQNYERKASPVKIINAILSGKLFPGLRILFSAREHAICHFESETRADRTAALIGFCQEDIEKLVLCYGGERGQDIWRRLTTEAQCLLSICSIPMFLNFTILVFLTSDKTPKTLTEVLMLTLYNMVTSEHMRSRESIYNIIRQLRKMAFNGTNEKRVTFTKKDLPCNLTIEKVQDLLIPYPGRSGLNQRLIDGSFRFIFSHQSLQEALSSLHVNQMPLLEFENFIEKIHQPQWAIVRRFTCGIVVNKTLQNIVSDVDLQEETKCKKNFPGNSNSPVTNIYGKCVQNSTIVAGQYLGKGAKSENVYYDSTVTAVATNSGKADSERQTLPEDKCSSGKTSRAAKLAILKESLTKELERAAGHRDLLELLHSLHECGEDIKGIVPESMTEIVLGDVIPSQADAYVIAAIAIKCDQIQHAVLNTINATQLYGLINVIKEYQLKVRFKDTTILQQGKELVNLFQIIFECGEDFHSILPPSLTTVILGDFVPSRRDFSIIVAIIRKCDQIRHVVLNTVNVSQLSGLTNVIKEKRLKVKFKDTTILQQGKKLVKLFKIFLECGNEIHSILLPSLTEIVLNDFVPSPEDVSVISSVQKMCDRHIKSVMLSAFDVHQLNALANVVNKFSLEVKILSREIEMKNQDLLELFRAFRKCGDSIAPLIRASVKIVDLKYLRLSKSNIDDLVFVLKLCSNLEKLSLCRSFMAEMTSLHFTTTTLQSVAEAVSTASLKIRNFETDIGEEFIQLPQNFPTICEFIPHVTDRLTLNLHVKSYSLLFGVDESLLSQLQKKLDSLLKTELKIEIGSLWRSYELGWKQPRRRLK